MALVVNVSKLDYFCTYDEKKSILDVVDRLTLPRSVDAVKVTVLVRRLCYFLEEIYAERIQPWHTLALNDFYSFVIEGILALSTMDKPSVRSNSRQQLVTKTLDYRHMFGELPSNTISESK